MAKILEFQGDYRFLSNFHLCSFTWDGYTWSHSEAAFQAAKSEHPLIRKKFLHLSPGQAKRYGRQILIRPDWDDVKIEVMAEILFAKFDQNPHLKQQLIDTGDAYLIEGNSWGDRFWGVSPVGSDNGLNHLGRLLMELRTLFQLEAKAPTANAAKLEELRQERTLIIERMNASMGGLVSFE